MGCSKLTSITIPDNVTSIGHSVFSYCDSLTSLYFMGDAPTELGAWGNINPNLEAYYIEGATGFDSTSWGKVKTIAMTFPATPLPAEVPISGKVVDADGNGLKGVKVSLENGTSVTTGDDGSFSIIASQGEHTLTFSGDKIEETTKSVTVDGDLDLSSVTVTLREDGGDNTMLLAAVVGVMAVVIVAAFIFVRMKK